MAGDIREGRGGLKEIGVIELRLAHDQPAVLQERVILLLRLKGHLFGIITPTRLLGGLSLDGVELDRLVALLDRTVERAARLGLILGLGADRVEIDHVRIVLLIALLHAQQCLVEGDLTIIIDIITGRQGMIEAARLGVLLRATRPKQA